MQSNVYVDVHEAWSHQASLPVPAPRISKDPAAEPNKVSHSVIFVQITLYFLIFPFFQNEDNIVMLLLSESEGDEPEIANGKTAVEVRKQAKIQRVSSDDLW